MDNDTVPTDTAAAPSQAQAEQELRVEGAPLVEQELLVEEISIDGMCGVY
ncbi:MAG: mycofactocin precursor MftA [Actinomycetota bacterium]